MSDVKVREQLDREDIHNVVQAERAARDVGDWERMKSFYHRDSFVDISWFRGNGSDFADATARMLASGTKTFHQLSPTVSQIRGDRALTDTGASVHLSACIDEIDVDVIGYARLRARLVRSDEVWLIAGFRVIYWQDSMIPFDPSRAPRLDRSLLDSYRSSYRFLSYALSCRGYPPSQTLPGIDRPDLLAPFLATEDDWLRSS